MYNMIDLIIQKYGAKITGAIEPEREPGDDDGPIDTMGRPTWRMFDSIVALHEYLKTCDGFHVRITRKKRMISLKFNPPIDHDDLVRRGQFDEAFRLLNLAADDIRICVRNGLLNLQECDDD